MATATTLFYTLSLHDALPICRGVVGLAAEQSPADAMPSGPNIFSPRKETSGWPETFSARRYSDRKSTRLNSSHITISYAVFCLKKKNNVIDTLTNRKISTNDN